MIRTSQRYSIATPEIFKKQLLQWGAGYRESVFLDSNTTAQQYGDYDAVLAVEAFTSIVTDTEKAFEKLNEFQKTTQDWLFGYVGYDAKNAIEKLSSNNFDGLHFPEIFFFQPQKIIFVKGNEVFFEYLNMVSDEIELDFEAIKQVAVVAMEKIISNPKIQQRISQQAYLEKVRELQEHIHRGDIYEVNFCMEFFQENYQMNPLATFAALDSISSAPFSVYLKNHHQYLLSASPERYLKKVGTKIISQPIKGTAKRSTDGEEDKALKEALSKDEKERSENIMITDLVRNDLSKTAKKGTVKVEELCGVYSFKQVHQMISTISSEMDEQLYNPVTAIETTFPMGSMTGAPKVSAMELIEQYEETKRGLYSGAVGYFTPEGDFDFNVVIRSILYNSENQYVSFSVGSAITAKSIPEKEYEECLLKAKAMMQVLGRY
ncbi:MAG: anthranilate synthase component I family protein [Flavobacteriales bacterium]|nr:anthranilate synthase component I family protein [Flavobacteriales bacterium]